MIDRWPQRAADVPQMQPGAFGVENRLADLADIGEGAARCTFAVGNRDRRPPAIPVKDAEADDVLVVLAAEPRSGNATIR